MTNISNLSSRMIAAISSIALSAACFAFAIAPASHNALQIGVIA